MIDPIAAFNVMDLAGKLERLTVQFAVAKYVEHAGDLTAQTARATRIKQIVTEVQGLLAGSVTIAQLQALTASDVANLNLSEADNILVNGLVSIVTSDLNLKVGAGILQAAASGIVNEFLTDILLTTAAYGAP